MALEAGGDGHAIFFYSSGFCCWQLQVTNLERQRIFLNLTFAFLNKEAFNLKCTRHTRCVL